MIFDRDQKTIITELYLLALCIWREAQNQSLLAKAGQAWTIRNRVSKPCWWGQGWHGVITKHEQFSAFNAEDPNVQKFPNVNDAAWSDCWDVADSVYNEQIPDPTFGATHYFDKSLDADPPAWATDGSMEKTAEIGDFRFWKAVTA